MINTGEKYGCLKVISNDFALNMGKLKKSIKELAEKEWKNSFDNWENEISTFAEYYKLNKNEIKAFNNKNQMPDSFCNKYIFENPYVIRQIPSLLWNKRTPDTFDDLVYGLLHNKLYEVECLICGNHYFMDKESICCFTKKSCNGAICLQHKISNKKLTYDNLCIVNNGSKTLQTLNYQLKKVDNIINNLSYYGGKKALKVSYISDIHLSEDTPNDYKKLYKLSNEDNYRKHINSTIRKLYDTLDSDSVIVFAGDIASNPQAVVQFYKAFVKYADYIRYKNKKYKLLKIQNSATEIERLKKDINKIQIKLFTIYQKLEQYKNRYYKIRTWTYAVKCYFMTPSFKNRNYSYIINEKLEAIAKRIDILEEKKRNFDRDILELETEISLPIDKLSVKDIYNEHHLLSENRIIFAVLGNHEFISFKNVKEAVSFYDKKFNMLGIKLLHNEHTTISINDNEFVFYGGTGFAKYNEKINAEIVPCCNNFTRNDEIMETTIFEKGYERAKKYAKEKGKCFLCISHYPIRDCMKKVDMDTIYFYGHTHENYFSKNEESTIYADNQVGYRNKIISFKTMSTGNEINPYFNLNDGLYETSIIDYLQFYKYLGEKISDGTKLYLACKEDKASIYVVKRLGFYGFFLVKTEIRSKGIYIIKGSDYKRITKSTDLQWIFDSFEVAIDKYLKLLGPLRNVQQQISKDLKLLGLSGKIHGCIVDIDYYHHIMVNPIVGTITYYYSSAFGVKADLLSFEEVISSMRKMEQTITYSMIDYYKQEKKVNTERDIIMDKNFVVKYYDKLLAKYIEMKKNNCILSMIGNKNVIDNLDKSNKFEEYYVSRSDSMYKLSRKINPLQKIFTNHVLCDFDIKLVGTINI